MDKKQREERRQQEDIALQRGLLWVVGAVVLEVLLVLLNRYYIKFSLSDAGVQTYLALHEVLKFQAPGMSMLYWLVIAWAVLAMVFYIYQREFFLGAAACSMSVLALWFARYGASGRPETLLIIAAIIVLTLGVLWLKKTDGVLPGRTEVRFLPKKASYAVPLVTCGASLLAVIVALAATLCTLLAFLIPPLVLVTAFVVLVAWLFALFVYYTVKLM